MIIIASHNLSRKLQGFVITLGVCAVALAALRLPVERVNVPLLLLALVAVNVGTRLRARIPRGGGPVTLADTLLVVVLLTAGGECAVLLAAVTALCSSLHA